MASPFSAESQPDSIRQLANALLASTSTNLSLELASDCRATHRLQAMAGTSYAGDKRVLGSVQRAYWGWSVWETFSAVNSAAVGLKCASTVFFAVASPEIGRAHV